jgi:hypothetical protein
VVEPKEYWDKVPIKKEQHLQAFGAGAHRGGGVCQRVHGGSLPYHFNNVGRGCKRPPKGAGCGNGRSGSYAHMCNFEFGNGGPLLGETSAPCQSLAV